jgi:dienelactone hydrolase
MSRVDEITHIYEVIAALRFVAVAAAGMEWGGGVSVLLLDQCRKLEAVADRLERKEQARCG